MGFSKKSAIDVINVRLTYHTVNQDTKEVSDVIVAHKLRVPDIEERNTYQKKLLEAKGRKIGVNRSEAAWYLWNKCILSVEGYDDLPADGNLRAYFTDDPTRQHIEDVIPLFVESYTGEEAEAEKKSV